jgi:hypothetical protein
MLSLTKYEVCLVEARHNKFIQTAGKSSAVFYLLKICFNDNQFIILKFEIVMSSQCIYCGINEANERDHIPPKSFFPEPRPSNLITVPSCSKCNRDYGKIDEIVRNLLTSFDTTEVH